MYSQRQHLRKCNIFTIVVVADSTNGETKIHSRITGTTPQLHAARAITDTSIFRLDKTRQQIQMALRQILSNSD